MSARIVSLAACAWAGCFVAGIAAAAEPGFYVGANYAQVDNSVKRDGYDELTAFVYDGFGFTPASGSATFDAKDSGYGFFGGYRFFTYLAVEGGYVDLGTVEHRDQSVGDYLGETQAWNQNVATKINGLTISALGILPLTYRFEVYARGGAIFANNEDTLFITNGIGSRKANGSKSSVNLLAGVGASFAFLEIYNARLEYQRAFDMGSDLGKGDIDMLSVGVTVTF